MPAIQHWRVTLEDGSKYFSMQLAGQTEEEVRKTIIANGEKRPIVKLERCAPGDPL